MQFTGVISHMSLPDTVTTKKGDTHPKQEIVVTELDQQYPNSIPFQQFGEKQVNVFKGLQEGDVVTVDFNINSSEYNGRNFAKISARKCNMSGAPRENYRKPQYETQTAKEMMAEVGAKETPKTERPRPEPNDDLPF